MLMDKLNEYARELLTASIGVLALAIAVFVGTPEAMNIGATYFIGMLCASVMLALMRPLNRWNTAAIIRRLATILAFDLVVVLAFHHYKVVQPSGEIVTFIVNSGLVVLATLGVLLMLELLPSSQIEIERIYRIVIGLLMISLALFARELFGSTTDWAWWMAAPLAGIILGLLVESLGKQVKRCEPGCLTILLCLFSIALGPLTPDTWVLKIHVAVMFMIAALFVFFRADSWPNRDEGW